MKLTLGNLVSRVVTDTELLKKHPENKEFLEKRIEKNKALIVECVLQNKYNALLDGICMKNT